MKVKRLDSCPILTESIKNFSADVQEALIELNSLHYTMPLYETRNNTKYVKNNLVQKFIAQNGVDFRGTEIHNPEDIAIASKILRDSRYETSRIFYIKNNKIVGVDGITSKNPSVSAVFPIFKNVANDYEQQWRGWYYYDSKKKKLGADGYYLVHNHPSGDASCSQEDINITKYFQMNIPGFLGHIILGKNEYGVIDIDLKFNKYSYDSVEEDEVINTLFMNDVANIARDYLTSDNYSVVIYSSTKGNLISIQEIKNSEFHDKNIGNYLSNQKRENGASSCFICTKDDSVADSLQDSLFRNIVTDVIFIKENNVYSIRDVNVIPYDKSYNILGKKDYKAYKVHED